MSQTLRRPICGACDQLEGLQAWSTSALPNQIMADLELTLSWLDMSQYRERFVRAGFDSWKTMLEIIENDLEASSTNASLPSIYYQLT